MANAFYVPHVHGAATMVLAGLQSMLAATMTGTWTHEDAHSKNAFNEFVDVVAKAELRRERPYMHLRSPAVTWAVTNPQFASWAFLFHWKQDIQQAWLRLWG